MAALLRFYGIVAACFVGYPASGLPILAGEPSKPSAAYITTRNITQFGPPKIHYMAPPNSNVFEWRDACALRVVIYNSTEKLNHGYDGCGHPELQGGEVPCTSLRLLCSDVVRLKTTGRPAVLVFGRLFRGGRASIWSFIIELEERVPKFNNLFLDRKK